MQSIRTKPQGHLSKVTPNNENKLQGTTREKKWGGDTREDKPYLPFQRAETYVFFSPARAPGTPKIGRKWRPRAPQISSDCPRKSLDFEILVEDRLGTAPLGCPNQNANFQYIKYLPEVSYETVATQDGAAQHGGPHLYN